MDDLLVRNTPGPTIHLDASMAAARGALDRAVTDFLAIPDSALAGDWMWNRGENEVRYGYYRVYEQLEEAAGAVRRILAATDPEPEPAVDPIAAATAARWDLHGLLASVTDADLDRDPGGGEWTLRQTFAHVVEVQRAYSWLTAWWLGKRHEPELPKRVPVEITAGLPDGASNGLGTLAEIRERLDVLLDSGAGRLAGLGHDEVAAHARWSGTVVTVGFRLWRWSSHLREHTIQVEKTLVMLDEPPSEAQRLVRMVVAAYGRLEAAAYGRTPEALARPGPDGRSAAEVIGESLASAPALASEVRRTALAAAPA